MGNAGDAIETYIAANNELKEAAKKVRAYLQVIRDVAKDIEFGPERFCFDGTEIGAPSGISASGRNRVEAADWPTAELLQVALVNWHEAYRRAREAWNEVPPSAQESLKSPDMPSRGVYQAR